MNSIKTVKISRYSSAMLAKHAMSTEHLSDDECVRAVTAFSSVADMMDTQANYSIKFNISRSITPSGAAVMCRVADIFNQQAEAAGQARRAVFF
jgi:hypothetical protein